MLVSIDQSRLWQARHVRNQELVHRLQAVFRDRPEQRPASWLEVLLLSRALECSEQDIGPPRARLLLMPGFRRPMLS